MARAYRGLFGAARDQFFRTSQPQGKSRNYTQRGLFGPIGAFRGKPPFAKPPLGFPEQVHDFGRMVFGRSPGATRPTLQNLRSANGNTYAPATHHNRGPQTHPKSRNTYQKTTAFAQTFSKVRANLLPCEANQELNRNCSEKLVQMNFFFRVDFPPLTQAKTEVALKCS